jgi:cell division protein FtsQ
MAAVLRGGSPSRAKPRAKPKAPQAKRGASAKSGEYHPAKLGAARRSGLPPQVALAVAGGVVLLGLVAAFAPDHRMQKIAATIGFGVERQLGGLGLKVANLTVQGATPMAQPDIVRASGVYRDQPILALDLEAVRRQVEAVGWVKQARVVRMLPDTIVVAVTQRPTLAVWQHAGHAGVIDDDGRLIPEADASRFPDLPLVVGEGANDQASAILSVVRGHPQVMEHLDALVRVDNRRWDLRLKDGGLIQLPAVGEDSALIQLDQLEQKSRLLELGFARIDLRNPELVAVRPRDAAPAGRLVADGA